jgi:hypothetical protein
VVVGTGVVVLIVGVVTVVGIVRDVAAPMFSSPYPYRVLGMVLPSGVAVCSRRCRISSDVGLGPRTPLAMTIAAAAETAGAAIEVPYQPLGMPNTRGFDGLVSVIW